MDKHTTAYIFNPEHDQAFGSAQAYYTAPANAVRLGRDLQLLPALYAEDGSFIVTSDIEMDKEWMDAISGKLRLSCRLTSSAHLSKQVDYISPWGWDRPLKNRLLHDGVRSDILPSTAAIERIRQVSHRRSSITIHNSLSSGIAITECHTLDEVQSFLKGDNAIYIKSPWSSSGQGVFKVTDEDLHGAVAKRISGIIQKQGSVLCEPALEKVLDFAMEFRITKGKVSFVGYSVFYNDSRCSYDYGLVADRETLESIILKLYPNRSHLIEVRTQLQRILGELIGDCYEGYLGVDMMLYRDACNKSCLNPCVELNLRMTMGCLTSIMGERFVPKGTVAKYYVRYFKTPYALKAFADGFMPYSTQNGQLLSGTLPLTPIYDDTKYIAYLSMT